MSSINSTTLFQVSSKGFWNLPEKTKRIHCWKHFFTFASPRYLYSGSPEGGHLATRAVLSSVIRLASAQVWLGFIHPPGVGILELISKNALEPVWNLPFFGDCVSPPKTRSGFPINTWVIWVPGTPMDSHHQPPFWFLCNPAAPARGQNGWWFASWVPSGNVWSRQWNSRHSSRFWTRRMRARRDDSEILHQAVEGRTNKKWWDHLPTSTGLQDFGQRYLKPSQTSSPRMTGWRKFQLDLHESSKDMSRFPGSMQKSQWPYVKQNKFPKGLWRRSGKGFTASAEADS